MKNQLELELKTKLHKIINRECWGIIAGEGTRSVIHINFGNKIPLKKPIHNKSLTEELRKNEAEWGYLYSVLGELIQKMR